LSHVVFSHQNDQLDLVQEEVFGPIKFGKIAKTLSFKLAPMVTKFGERNDEEKILPPNCAVLNSGSIDERLPAGARSHGSACGRANRST
jgi:hypothetical protein